MTDLERLRTLIKAYPNCAKRYMNEYGTSASMHRRTRKPITIKDVIFNDPATIVFWSDGTKTVVKCQEGDIFDKEKGLAMAISKKSFGNKGSYYEVFKEFCKDDPVEESDEVKVVNNVLAGYVESLYEEGKKILENQRSAFKEVSDYCNHDAEATYEAYNGYKAFRDDPTEYSDNGRFKWLE